MNTITEIQLAIERLSPTEVAELVIWLEQYCQQRQRNAAFEVWLSRAVGAAKPGVTTEEVMSLMRDEPCDC